jgi:hypothetical protein
MASERSEIGPDMVHTLVILDTLESEIRLWLKARPYLKSKLDVLKYTYNSSNKGGGGRRIMVIQVKT